MFVIRFKNKPETYCKALPYSTYLEYSDKAKKWIVRATTIDNEDYWNASNTQLQEIVKDKSKALLSIKDENYMIKALALEKLTDNEIYIIEINKRK